MIIPAPLTKKMRVCGILFVILDVVMFNVAWGFFAAPFWPCLLLGLGFPYLFGKLSGRYVRRKDQKLRAALLNDGQLRLYIRYLQDLLMDEKNPIARQAYLYEIGRTEILIGELSRAKDRLARMTPYGRSLNEGAYHDAMLCEYSLAIGDHERAEAALACLDALRTTQQTYPEFAEMVAEEAALLRAYLELAQGKYEGKREYFEQRLSTAETLSEQVKCHYCLALLATHEENREESQTHLQFLASQSEDFAYTAWAKEKLQVLEEQ